jgi:hypothetical protein
MSSTTVTPNRGEVETISSEESSSLKSATPIPITDETSLSSSSSSSSPTTTSSTVAKEEEEKKNDADGDESTRLVPPPNDPLARGLYELFLPVVREYDARVQALLQTQEQLSSQIDRFASGMRRRIHHSSSLFSHPSQSSSLLFSSSSFNSTRLLVPFETSTTHYLAHHYFISLPTETISFFSLHPLSIHHYRIEQLSISFSYPSTSTYNRKGTKCKGTSQQHQW